jgi:NMD protein affecting ribosome stability and mRNA decay
MPKIPTILTPDEFRAFLDVSKSSKDETVVNRAIRDAQNTDIVSLLGFEFYSYIINNLDDVDVLALLDGDTYEYDSKTYFNVGLKQVVAYYAYAKYILVAGQKDTPFGLVQKNSQNSEHISTARIKEIATSTKQSAYEYWVQVQLFLDRNSANYPLWSSSCSVSKRNSGFRISKITRS